MPSWGSSAMNEIQRINPPSSVVISERKYPVITENPSWTQICGCRGAAQRTVLRPQLSRLLITNISLCPTTVGNLRSEDLSLLIKSTAAGAPLGYWLGACTLVPHI